MSIPEGPLDAERVPSVADVLAAPPDRRPELDAASARAVEQPSANGAKHTSPGPAQPPVQHPLPAGAPASHLQPAPVARPKIKLRLKLPRAPSPSACDKTESPLGLCFPSPPAPVPLAPAPKPVPAELLAAFGGPGEGEDSPTEDASTELQALRLPSTGRAATPVGRASSPGAARPAGERERVGVEHTLGLSLEERATWRLPADSARHGAQGARPSAAVLREGALAPAPLHKSLGLPPELEIRASIADAGTQREQSVAIPRSPSAQPSTQSRDAPVPERASAVSSQSGADVDMDAAAGSSATGPRAPSSRADSPGPLSAGSSLGGQDVHMDVVMELGMDMGVGMDMTEADIALTRLASPPPAATIPRKRARTPLPEQRALSSPRRSPSPASPPALALPSFHSPSPPLTHASPHALRASPSPHAALLSPPHAPRSSPAPQPHASPGSGPMSPPWSPVALPEEMMQLLALGAGPLPMPVFEPLPAPPPDDEAFGSDEDVERLLEGVPPPPPPTKPAGEGEKKVAKKRKRRASGKRKSRAVVGDSD